MYLEASFYAFEPNNDHTDKKNISRESSAMKAQDSNHVSLGVV